MTLADLFAAQAARTPEAVALVAGGERWTYRELDRRAARIARHLRELGVGPEVRVGICLRRSADLPAALLGVLKAGGAYVPLDPAYPEERLRFLLADSAASVVLTEERLLGRLGWIGSAAQRVCLDLLPDREDGEEEPAVRAGSGNLAYLIYTSGSTGRPKGVAIEHRSAVAMVEWARRSFPADELAGMLASTSINFDLSVFELFVPLACGGKVILAENALELPVLPAAGEVTFVNTVPSAMAELVRTGGVPRSVLAVGLAGEPLPQALAGQIHALGTVRRLYNLYGPSEDTTYSTWAAVDKGEDGPPSIGRPIDGGWAILLDAAGEPAAEGEILLGGTGLARGYLGRPELTAERFVPDPFGELPGGRLYRTGDLARLRPDGVLDFLGRLDHQVKIRGFRIELGEIETWLGRHPGVRQTIVVAREDRPGDRRLVTYFVAEDDAAPSAHELREGLRQSLPEHMVPSAFVRLDAFPLTPNGKIDRRALPAPAAEGAGRDGFVAPRTALERQLAGIWGEVLGLDAETGQVGSEDDFFALGGHSLHATQVLSRVRDAFGVALAPRQLFTALTVAGLAALLEAAGPADGAPAIPPLTRFPREPRMPPSFAQERLWFVEQFAPGTATYNVPAALRFHGPLDAETLERSLNEVVRRHEALRTALVATGGKPFQVIAPELVLELPRTDLSGARPEEREEEALRRAEEEARRPFDLARLPLLRAHLFRLAEEEHLLLLNLHHVISDDWSLWILVRELGAIYRAFSAGRPSPLPELAVQYPDFALWQRGWLQGEVYERQLGYWKRQLAGAPAALDLPLDRPRPQIVTFPGKRHDFALPGELAQRLAALSREQGATPFMTLLAAFGVQLGRISRQDDVLIGFPVANRNWAEVEGLIGFFTNTLVLRVGLAGRPDFRSLLARVRDAALDGSTHQDLPFESLAAELAVERQLGRQVLFQVMFALQNAPRPPREIAPGLTADLSELDSGTAKVDLSLLLWEADGGLAAVFEYNTDLLDESTVARLAGHYLELLAGIAADPGRPVSELPLLTGPEERQVLGTWNATGAAPGWQGSVGELFEDQARRTPDAPALALGEEALTYGELAARTGRLARRLRALGVGPEVLVGLCAERSIGLIEGLLAIWRAGGACVPIHPSYPRERMSFLLEDTRVPVLITRRRLAEALPVHPAQVVLLDSLDAGDEMDEERSGSLPAPGNLAYVIYTSGSTGRPKGVGVPHGAFASHCAVYAAYHGFSPADRVLQFSELSFDAALEQIVPPFLAGAALVLRGEELWGSEETIRAIETTGATVLDLPTALLHQVLRRLAEGEDTVDAHRVRLLLTGGEAMPPQTPDFWRRSPLAAAELQNGYGPTEAVISGTFFQVPPEPGWIGSGGAVSIGRPLPGRKLYILDAAGLPIPAGVPGEIHLGGPLLARGYLGLPALTAERFVPDPFGGEPGGRLYRTGDLARWAPHGDIEFLGRLDHQVKVRGFRIELGEIEVALGRHPAVEEGVVALSGAADGERRLVAWLVPAGEVPPTAAELRSFLRESLPEHMVPAAFLVLPSFPRTTGGKVDRRALPSPEEALRAEAGGAAAAPRTPVEEVLAGLWAELLGVERVGIHESFFELGGHSLLATQLISRIRHVLGADLSLRALFLHPTVAGLAAELRGGKPPRPIPRAPRAGDLPLSFAQERLWFLEQLNPGTAAFNITVPLRLDGRLDIRVLAACFDELVRRHEPLRSRFVVRNGRPGQVIEPPAPCPLPVADLAELAPEARSREVNRLGLIELRRPFDLARGPLFRVTLLHLERESHVLLLGVHHAVADGWAVGVMTRELMDLYQAFLAGRPSPLPELPIQPVDFAVWQREELAGERLERELAWWRQQIGPQTRETPAELALPTDRPRPQSPDLRGRRQRIEIPAARLEPLKRLGRRRGATLFMSLLAVLAAQLHRSSGARRIPVGTPIANRNRAEIEGVMGMFINTLVLTVDLAALPTFAQLLARVQEVTLGGYEHQDLPYEKLVQALQPDRQASRQGLFQVFFALDNTPAPAVELPGLSFQAFDLEGAESMTATFDLSILLAEADGGVGGFFSFATALFDPSTVQRMVEHFGILLDGAAADPECPLTELPFLGPAERHQLATPEATAPAAPRKESRAELEARVARSRSGLSASKRDLLEQRLRGKAGKVSGGSGALRIPRRTESGPAPLSFAQERLWFLDRLEPGSAAYNIPTALRLEGGLHLPALAAALAEVRRRHEVLRATFGESDGKPFQVTAPLGAAALPQVDLGGLEAEAREAEVRRLVRADAARPFDLESGPLLRTTLARLAARSHVLLLSAHHIVFDAWSSGVFTREMGALYAAFAAGAPSPLPEPEIQYADFAAWQAEWLRGEVLEAQLAYWRQRLADAPAALELPTDRPRPAVVSPRGGARVTSWGTPLARGLGQLAKESGATLFMVALAGFQALLSRSTVQHDVCVGTPVAGRNRLEIEPLIGFFVNTLVLRTDLAGDPSFRDLVERVREVTLGAYAHQDLPFERLVQEINPARSLSRTPLFQVVFSLQNATAETLALPGLALRGMADDTPVAKFDLTLVLEESEHGLRAVLEHSADLFDGTTAQRLLAHLGVLLSGAVESPERRLSDLPLLSDEERAQVVWEWNAMAQEQREHPRGQTLAGLFAAQVERTPDAVALVAGMARWTYRELDLQASRLAAGLRTLGVGPEVRVGIHLDRSPEMVAALLGVLAAGGAYVPLDPDYPEERLAFLLADSAAPVVLCAEHRAERLARIAPGVRIVRLEEALETQRVEGVDRAADGSLAYLIYTSGSTGRPKGVAIEHRQAVAMVRWALDTFAAGDLAGMLASTSINFDLSVFELFVPLSCGGKAVLAGNALELPALPAAGEVTFVNTVPSAMSELLHGGGLPPSVTTVGLAGEPLPRSLAQRIHALGTVRRLYNLYGPSESTTYSTWTLLDEDDARPPTLGRPIANTGIYLLDASLAPVGIGTPGELYVGGAGVARGYHGRPELTAERFVPDPFGTEPGARLYRTGDLARWGRTGETELLGRVDFQVKLRGFRIELGEIEAALGCHPGVRQTVVVLRPAEQRLVAYVVPSAEPVPEITAGGLRGFLCERLPGHMVPAAFVTLAALPLSPNGKVDRRRLPEPDGGTGEGGETYLAPRTPVEEVLAAIWSEVLGVDRIGVRDSFFERGGHSLLATRVIARIRATLGVELPLKAIFEAPTVADLALAVARVQRAHTAGTGPEAPLRPAPRKGPLRLSFAQERLWFLDQLEPESALYNMPMAFLLEGELRVPALAAACREIVRRHEVLRSVFPSVSGEPVQVIRPAAEPVLFLSLPLVDLGGLPAERRESAARDLVRQEVRRPFDLARGPLFRALLVRLDERTHAFCAGMHHIVSDGGSLQIFERELAALYTAAAAGHPSPLPDLPLQYADFAAWQREWLQGAVLEGQIGYWRERLAGAPPVLDLPLDRSRPKELGQRGASRSVELPAHLAHEIAALGRAEAATPFMIVLAAFAALLARSAAGTDILVGAPVAGRDRLELEPLIGLFVNTLVLRTDLAGDPDVRELLRRARQTVLDAHAHQDLPFERLVEELQPQRSLAHTPLFQVLLVQAPRGESSGLPGLAVRAFGAESGTAKFDLTLALGASEQGLGLSLEYRTDLFDATTAQRLLAHLGVLLAGMGREPRSRLSDLPLLTVEERAQVVTEWNATGLALPGEETLDGLFEAQAGRTPDAVALVAGAVRWSYCELDRRTDGLARRLRALGVGPEVRVGVHLERSPEMVVALLAVLRAGGAYVPLDPGYPEERLAFLVADSAAAVVLSGADCVDEPFTDEAAQAVARPAGNGHMAYLIYTSGSTGRPKGVAIEHRSAVAMVRWALASFAPGDLAGMLASTSINFDLSVFELFVPLACGARVHLAANALELPSLPAASEVTFVNTVPSAMAELVRTGGLPPSVTAVGLAGEPLPLGLVRQLYASGTVQRVYNLYGPSEGTTYSTWALLDPASERAPSIGRPVANTEIYLLDAGFAPVGVGSTGELYVGGAGVARGYLGRPELTAERFLPDPFAGRSGARVYRTGDLARWQTGGEIEFLGRADFQVKVRGFRIELGEIEAVLGRHPGVRETVVVLAESPSGMPGDRRVVAYVAVQGEPEAPAAGDLRRFLQERLPDHMVPTAWVLLDALPRTPNGKVDRRALPTPDAAAGPESSFVAPRNPVEEVLAGIWAEVLGRDEVGVRDDFFALGGHSLLATRIIAQVKAAFRVEIGLQSLFREPTVEQMAAALLAGGGERIERTAELLLELAATPDEDVESLLGEDDPAAAGLHR